MDEKLRILCVDDEGCVLRSLERLFLDEDYEIVTAASAADGLAIMEQAPAQIVISDYQMPGMNGVAFLRRIRTSWPDTVRLVLSGQAPMSAIMAAINDGEIYRFIQKPWTESDLKAAIAGAAEKYRLQRDNARQVEELRSKSAELQVFRTIVDSLLLGVIGIDTGGTVVAVNRAWEVFSGMSASGIVGRSAAEGLPAGIVALLAGELSQQPLDMAGKQYMAKKGKMIGPGTTGIIVTVEAA